MCTAISYRTPAHYFGRTLDLEYGYHETVTVTHRRYPLPFRLAGMMKTHHALIGIATVDRTHGYPLYYDAANEVGLAAAALNFPGYAVYRPAAEAEHDRIAPFELIPWVLGQCESVDGAEALLRRCDIVEIPFSDALPLTPLHWIIADRHRSLVAEATAEGLRLYSNPADVLTNSPPFPAQMAHLQAFRGLSREEPPCRLSPALDTPAVSRGLGAIGLPGDWSSPSRFVRAAFAVGNAPAAGNEIGAVEQFFRLADSVSVPRGCVQADDDFVITRYTSCCSTARGIYYWTTHDDRHIRCVDLHKTALQDEKLITFPLRGTWQIDRLN